MILSSLEWIIIFKFYVGNIIIIIFNFLNLYIFILTLKIIFLNCFKKLISKKILDNNAYIFISF